MDISADLAGKLHRMSAFWPVPKQRLLWRMRLLGHKGDKHWQAEELGEAADALKAYLDLAQRLVGSDDEAEAIPLSIRRAALGSIYCLTGHEAEGELLMTQSGDFLRAYRGTRDFQFSSALMNLGVAYLENKRHAEALEWLLAAKELRSELAGPESFEVAQCHTNLGVAYEHLGEFDKAETELRAALEIYTRLLGNDCDQVVRALNNLSRTLRKAGRLEESRAAVESALQIGQEIGSSVLGQCLDAAAGVYEAQGQLQQAYLARNKAIAHAFSHGHFADQQEFLPLQIALLERMERPAEAEQLRQALADVLRRQQNRTSSRQESAYA